MLYIMNQEFWKFQVISLLLFLEHSKLVSLDLAVKTTKSNLRTLFFSNLQVKKMTNI